MLRITYKEGSPKIMEWLKSEETKRFSQMSTEKTKVGEGIFDIFEKETHIEIYMKDTFFYGHNDALPDVIFKFFEDMTKEFPDAEIVGSVNLEDKYSSACIDITYKPGQKINIEYNTLCDICGKKIPKNDAYISLEEHYGGFCSFKCAFDFVFGEEDDGCDEIEELDGYDCEANDQFWEDFCEYCDEVLTPNNAERILEMLPEEYEDAVKCVETYIDENCY